MLLSWDCGAEPTSPPRRRQGRRTAVVRAGDAATIRGANQPAEADVQRTCRWMASMPQLWPRTAGPSPGLNPSPSSAWLAREGQCVMSNTETHSPAVDCAAPAEHDPEHVQLVEPKDVQPGGEDALKVRRTLPSLRRSFVGAWCFVSGSCRKWRWAPSIRAYGHGRADERTAGHRCRRQRRHQHGARSRQRSRLTLTSAHQRWGRALLPGEPSTSGTRLSRAAEQAIADGRSNVHAHNVRDGERGRPHRVQLPMMSRAERMAGPSPQTRQVPFSTRIKVTKVMGVRYDSNTWDAAATSGTNRMNAIWSAASTA